ncbi:hypothetical protein N7447_001285 [Penicillium robsamsonii]|uniref:uncharacterized protein n=1 Tax=Penicillium robsamsonii TaxID=1792511 RepID=UPI002548D332|nr:uncharacterized protein N7447_001285 [Penicillium robsamsonii]KAJ5835259.1 hypothetical protein N7447_001285 [Penicillium robsamsonii]
MEEVDLDDTVPRTKLKTAASVVQNAFPIRRVGLPLSMGTTFTNHTWSSFLISVADRLQMLQAVSNPR